MGRLTMALGRELSFLRAGALCLLAWFLLPSGLFLQPQSLLVRPVEGGGYEVDFARLTPFGAVRAAWETELQARAECQDDGLAYYEQRGGRVKPYPMSKRLARCLEPGAPFALVTYHTVRLFGLLPLRPSPTVWLCPQVGRACKSAGGGDG